MNCEDLILCDEFESELNIFQVLKNVKMSKILSLTKNGRPYDLSAESLIDSLNKYSTYCVEDMKKDYEDSVRKIVYAAGECGIDDNYLYILLYSYKTAGEFMEEFHSGKSLDDICALIYWPIDSCTLTLMLKYSSFGLEFVERIEGAPKNRNGLFDAELCDIYREKKTSQEKVRQLGSMKCSDSVKC